VVVSCWIILARSALDGGGSDMVVVAAVEWTGDDGGESVASLEEEEDRRPTDTKFSRASAPSNGGPCLLSS
jgi:hypothetical protein